MYKAMGCWVFVAIASVLLAGSLALAQGKGKGRGSKPPGWGRGEKKGWQGDLPPGIEKKGGWLPPGLTRTKEGKEKSDQVPGWSRGRKEGWSGIGTPPQEEDEKEKGIREKEKVKAEKIEARVEKKKTKQQRETDPLPTFKYRP